MIAKAKVGDIRAAKLLFDVTGIAVKHHEVTVSGEAENLKTYIAVDVDKV